MKYFRNGKWIVWLIVLYVATATMIYRFGHPEQTETQLFKNIPKALIFQR